MKRIMIFIILILCSINLLWTESVIKLKKRDYIIVDKQNNYSEFGIKILNKKILSRLITENDFILLFSVNKKLYKAKGQTMLQAAVPDDCEYVFFTDENGKIFITDNKIKLYKVLTD